MRSEPGGLQNFPSGDKLGTSKSQQLVEWMWTHYIQNVSAWYTCKSQNTNNTYRDWEWRGNKIPTNTNTDNDKIPTLISWC
jgi:hypothetical protein